jgi:hypothetical protein
MVRTIGLYESGALAEEAPVDRLRACVNWLNHQNETFVQSFSMDKLIRLHAYATCRQDLPEFADSWSEQQIDDALR